MVEGLGRELDARHVALRSGDVIVGWARGDAAGPIRSPFELGPVALEQLPRGVVVVSVERNGQLLPVDVPPRVWPFEIEVRPPFEPDVLALYEQGRALFAEKKTEEGVRRWREAAEAGKSADSAATCWLLGRIGAVWADAGRRQEFEAAYTEALACAKEHPPGLAAALQSERGWRAVDQAWLDVAEEAFRAVVEGQKADVGPLAVAEGLRALGRVHYLKGRTPEAVELFQRALRTQEAEAPESLPVVRTLLDIGRCASASGDREEAERIHVRAEGLSSAIAPGSTQHIAALTGLGGVISARGDWLTTQRLWMRALELSPEESQDRARMQMNLGALAFVRGDLEAAESWGRRALALSQKTGARRTYVTQLRNLAAFALARGDLDAGERFLNQAMAEQESVALDPYLRFDQSVELGRVRRRRSDPAGAKAAFERALAEGEQASLGGSFLVECLLELADMARAERDWPRAEALYRRGLWWQARSDPPGEYAARVLHGLGTVERARGREDEAAAFFARAVAALEGMRGRTGGSDEARAFFDSQFYGIYHDRLEQLVRVGRLSEAYDVLELSRARSLLALLAERDVLLEDEIAPELEQKRRALDAEYQRTHERLLELDPAKEGQKANALALRLAELRDAQNGVAAKVREASPRLADVRYPEPLTAPEVQASLAPGTVLLAYSVGPTSTVLFSVGSVGEGRGLEAVTIPVGEADLRRRVERWRELVERSVPRPDFYREARALYDLLLRPLEARLRSAKRLLVSPGGALHALPFSALRRKEGYLADGVPLTIVPSGTVYARWAASRKASSAAAALVGFADPTRSAAGLEALPDSRRELDAVARSFAKRSLHVGRAATEDRVKGIGLDARYVHFACHALVNDRLPLDSGLVLHAPTGEKLPDDGLLQAWEIYERVRIDADLVTLSACRSGGGTVRAGEGILGLTRAFQYAGARSVLASLWSVGDASSLWFMERFYGHLARGVPKDEALQRTQRAAIRAGHHPIRWAAYQMYGDWR